jgi:hypothetical protein
MFFVYFKPPQLITYQLFTNDRALYRTLYNVQYLIHYLVGYEILWFIQSIYQNLFTHLQPWRSQLPALLIDSHRVRYDWMGLYSVPVFSK